MVRRGPKIDDGECLTPPPSRGGRGLPADKHGSRLENKERSYPRIRLKTLGGLALFNWLQQLLTDLA